MSTSSGLGTLLTQRVDAVLGHTAASHPHLVTGLRADAVAAAAAAARLQAPEDVAQHRLQSAGSVLDARQATADRPHAHDPSQLPVAAASAQPRLGATARLISALLSDVALDHHSLRGTSALIPPLARHAPAVAAKLRQALQHSGLFYESYLADWVAGRAAASVLRAQPQRAWAPTGDAQAPEAAAMLRMQLEALATQSISWQGIAWDDVPVAWQMRRRAETDAGGEDADPTWTSELTLDLPHLGHVVARVTWRADALSIQVQTESAALLQAARDSIDRRLRDAQLPVNTLDILAANTAQTE